MDGGIVVFFEYLADFRAKAQPIFGEKQGQRFDLFREDHFFQVTDRVSNGARLLLRRPTTRGGAVQKTLQHNPSCRLEEPKQ